MAKNPKPAAQAQTNEAGSLDAALSLVAGGAELVRSADLNIQLPSSDAMAAAALASVARKEQNDALLRLAVRRARQTFNAKLEEAKDELAEADEKLAAAVKARKRAIEAVPLDEVAAKADAAIKACQAVGLCHSTDIVVYATEDYDLAARTLKVGVKFKQRGVSYGGETEADYDKRPTVPLTDEAVAAIEAADAAADVRSAAAATVAEITKSASRIEDVREDVQDMIDAAVVAAAGDDAIDRVAGLIEARVKDMDAKAAIAAQKSKKRKQLGSS